jgi:DNA (cytosine-5)-methyltransferase 1
MINGLDLFSGIGGIALALREWVEPVAYCEYDRYAQAVLLSRMQTGDLVDAPIWDDVRTLQGEHFDIPIDIVYGGFPCQDLSAAGSGAGLAGERSGLYFELERIVRETKPTFVFLENVPAIRTRGLGRVVWGLSELGYDLRWTVVSAQEVGAPHLRKRWFLLAHANGAELRIKSGRRRREDRQSEAELKLDGPTLAHAKETWKALAEHRHSSKREWPSWLPEPALCRGHNGLSARVDRLRGLGNAVVPEQAREAFKRLMGL